jgi:hypothetical protein
MSFRVSRSLFFFLFFSPVVCVLSTAIMCVCVYRCVQLNEVKINEMSNNNNKKEQNHSIHAISLGQIDLNTSSAFQDALFYARPNCSCGV